MVLSRDFYPDMTWHSFNDGDHSILAGFLDLMGTVHVVSYGSESAQGWAVSIPIVHPGAFSYSPILQDSMLPLLLLVTRLAQCASTLAIPITKEEGAIALKASIELNCAELIGEIQVHKSIARRHAKAINSLRRRTCVYPDLKLGEMNLTYRCKPTDLASLIVSVGAPQSAERRAQVQELSENKNFTLDNADCPKGSDIWLEVQNMLRADPTSAKS